MNEFVISKSQLDERKNDDKTFSPFNGDSSDNVTFKSSWGLYGSGKPPEKIEIGCCKPRGINDIMGNKDNIKLFQRWVIQKMEKVKTYDYCVVLGSQGSGKSEFIRQCFSDLECSLIEYDQAINKVEMEVISDTIQYSNIEMMLSGKNQKGVVIDNFQNNLSKVQLTEILKILKKTPNSSPVVLVSSNDRNLLNSIGGDVLCISVEPPNEDDIISLGRRIRGNITDKALREIAVNNGYNLRNFISTIAVLDDGKMSDGSIESILKRTQKDINLSLENTMDTFVNPENIVFKESGFGERMSRATIYTTSVIQENYINMLKKDTSLDDMTTLCDTVCESDILKKYMVSTQTWDMYDLVGISGTETPSSIIRVNYKGIRKYKTPNRFESTKQETNGQMPIMDICYSISKILFVMNPESKWIKQMNKSADIFKQFMVSQYINRDKAIKLLGVSYSLEDKTDPKVVTKIKTKFRNSWRNN